MFPKKFSPILFGFLLSGMMSLLVSGISTYRAASDDPHLISMWMSAWLTAWLIAFPVVLVVAPFTRRLVGILTRDQ